MENKKQEKKESKKVETKTISNKKETQVKSDQNHMTQLLTVVSSEKSLRMMESNNGLIFIFSKQSSKKDIKQILETRLGAKVSAVNTTIVHGNKKAFVYFSKETPAIDVATKLGLL